MRGKRELKQYLREHFYEHPRVLRMTDRAQKILTDLFAIHRDDPALLPEKVRAGSGRDDPARMVCDYIAGMTDRFAMATHARLASAHERH